MSTIDIAETNDHVVRVESTDNEVFVVAVGRDPNAGVAALRGGAAAVGILALLLGAGLILLGARRSKATIDAPQWPPGAGAPPPPFTYGPAPQGPPVYGQPVGPPPYAQPGPPPYAQPGTAGSTGRHRRRPTDRHRRRRTASRVRPNPGHRDSHSRRRPEHIRHREPHPAPGQPAVPGQPGWGPAAQQPAPPGAPAHPAASVQPTEWAPQRSDTTAVPADTAPPDEDFLARLRDERDSDASAAGSSGAPTSELAQ